MRTINLPFNLGFRKDLLYCGTSSRAPIATIENRFPTEESKKQFHFGQAAISNTSIPISGYIGKGMIDSEKGRSKFNRCLHTSFQGVSLGYGYWIKDYWDNPIYGNYAGFRKSPISGNPVTDVKHLSLETSQAASRAWWTMQPRFEGQISMINFLYELKDVKSLLGQAYNLLRGLKNLRKISSKFSKNPKYDPSKPLASVYLQNEFGIKPLIRDLATIIGQLGERVQAAQEEFLALGRTEDGLTSHYSETLASSNNFQIGTKNNYIFGYGTETKTRFTATLRYNYDYKLRSDFDAFMKYWGLSGSAEAVWEAIPFSFLIDYFIKIGKAIHAMEVDPNVKLFDIKYCESLKTTKTDGTHLRPDSRVITYYIDGHKTSGGLVAGYRGTTYYRYPTVPNKGLYVPKLSSSVTNKQATNIAAVLRTLI